MTWTDHSNKHKFFNKSLFGWHLLKIKILSSLKTPYTNYNKFMQRYLLLNNYLRNRLSKNKNLKIKRLLLMKTYPSKWPALFSKCVCVSFSINSF